MTTEIPPLPFTLRQQCERFFICLLLVGYYVLNQQTVQGENHRRQGSVVIGNGGFLTPIPDYTTYHYLFCYI